MSKRYKINEIFFSIQGEGFNHGMPAVFIRFANCNLNCLFCDTEFEERMELSILEIIKEIQIYKCENIILTGGEPMLQVDKDLLIGLKEMDFKIHLETNATINIPFALMDLIDWITLSPKIEDLTNQRGGDELKVVYQGQDLRNYSRYFVEYFFLQPCDENGKMNISETIEKIKEDPKWRLSLQIHKMINIK